MRLPLPELLAMWTGPPKPAAAPDTDTATAPAAAANGGMAAATPAAGVSALTAASSAPPATPSIPPAVAAAAAANAAAAATAPDVGPLGRNFALVYIELALERATPQERMAAVRPAAGVLLCPCGQEQQASVPRAPRAVGWGERRGGDFAVRTGGGRPASDVVGQPGSGPAKATLRTNTVEGGKAASAFRNHSPSGLPIAGAT